MVKMYCNSKVASSSYNLPIIMGLACVSDDGVYSLTSSGYAIHPPLSRLFRFFEREAGTITFTTQGSLSLSLFHYSEAQGMVWRQPLFTSLSL